MMKVLIKQARILDPGSTHHRSTRDILIVDGRIQQISPFIDTDADQIIQSEQLIVSPGWIDIFANFCDPGYEFKETLSTGANAAAAGGFTRIMVVPNTKPVIDLKTQVEYITRKSADLPVNVIPIGAITKNTEGKELSEMYDMQESGAITFSDGTKPVQSAGMMVKALQYVKRFNGVIIQMPDDKTMASHGLMNEGIVSTQLGLPGKPVIAEELLVNRDIALAAYTGSRLHITGISSPAAVEAVFRAKQQGVQVTCSVTPYHLFFCDEDLNTYDSNLKVNPPLRRRQDMLDLRIALLDGKIDCIASHHFPHEFDSKILEFEYARNGMITLESLFGVLLTAIPELTPERCVELLHTHPAQIFSMKTSAIEEGQQAELTMFQTIGSYTFEKNHIKSRSKNSPFIGKDLTGKIVGIINGQSVSIN